MKKLFFVFLFVIIGSFLTSAPETPPKEAVTTCDSEKNAAVAAVILCGAEVETVSSSSVGTTYYIRTDGGTNTQCTGRVDAPYPGTGTNQPCAWSHPFWALDSSGNWKIQGGDTIIIAPGSYMMGYGAPNTSGWCDASYPYECDLPPLPSGPDSNHPTRILGKGWDSGCPNPSELWGTQRPWQILDLTGSSNVYIGCLEITDHSSCVEFHSNPSVECERDTYPFGHWASSGILASDSSNVTLKHLNIHGLASHGIVAGRISNWTVEDVRLAGNGWVGWEGDLPDGSDSNSGTLHFKEWVVEWNGCGETYPGEQPHNCWAQTAGGYGDGVGTGTTGGHWIIEDSVFRYNTSDGLDLLYARQSGSQIEIKRTMAYGNAGDQIKVNGDTAIENCFIKSNCGYFNGKSFTWNVDDCRAGGSALALSLRKGNTISVINSTIAGQGDCLCIVECDDSSCNGSEKVIVQNNIFRGYPDFTSPGDTTCYFWFDQDHFYQTQMDYNVIYKAKMGDNAYAAHDLNQNPLVVNDTLDSFDGHLQASSPAIDSGLAVGSLNGLVPSDDLEGNSRPSGSGVDRGAYEYGSSTASITVISPNGSESWAAGSSQSITWTSSGSVGNVKIEYSSNNGASWSTISASTANDGLYSWTVPNVSSNQCLVRVSETDGSPTDTSDSIFTITSSAQPQIALNRTQLYFGGYGSAVTGSQTFFISNSASGTLNWSASSNKNWLSCTPTSGIDSGVVTVTVDPSGLSSGTHAGTVTISDSNASNSPQTVNVTLKVYAAGSHSPPFGFFTTPPDGAVVRSSVPVTGWALDDIQVENVKIYRAHAGSLVYIGDAFLVEGARPDVEQTYPTYPFNYRAGWGYMMLTNFLPNQGNGTFTIHAIVTDTEGHQVTLGTKTITCDNANAVKPFGAIDTPAQGGTAAGSACRNWGWVLTPMPNAIPTGGSTINVYVDSVNLGHPVYNIYRADIAGLFPGYANSNGAIAYFDFDTTTYANGVHTIYWTASDSAGNTDGIGSRYFTIQNSQGAGRAAVFNVQRSMFNVNLKEIPVDQSHPVFLKKGYHPHTKPVEVYPNDIGHIIIEIKELERLEIHFSNDSVTDKSSTESSPLNIEPRTLNLSPLPIGSTLDRDRGIFYWQPGPGFIGEYQLVFIEKRKNREMTKINIIMKIVSKF